MADYRVAEVADQKLRKPMITMSFLLNWVKIQIYRECGKFRKDRPFVVGFAAETQNVAEYAKSKLQRKNLDMICAMMYRVGKYSTRSKCVADLLENR